MNDKPISEMTDKELLEYKKYCEQQVAIYNNKQSVQKVLLNSLYGAGGNEFFRYYDLSIAEAVTTTAQLIIRYVARRFNEYMKKQVGIEQAVVYVDTDSSYLDFSKVVERIDPKGELSEKEITDKIDQLCENKIQKLLDKWFYELFVYLNGRENTLKMKREKICSAGFWVSKKRYVLRVLDSEGVRYEHPEIEVSGLESKKSSTPAPARKALLKMYELILDDDIAGIKKLIREVKEQWMSMSIYDISLPSSVNGIEEYTNTNGLPKKGTPAHIYGAIMYNWYLNQKGLTKYRPIQSGDKIRYVYMKQPNPVKHTHVISFDDENILEELGLVQYVDRELMFEKGFMSAAKHTLEACSIQITDKRSLGV